MVFYLCVSVCGCAYVYELELLSDLKCFVLREIIWSHWNTAMGGSRGVWVHLSSPPVTHLISFLAWLEHFFSGLSQFETNWSFARAEDPIIFCCVSYYYYGLS